MISAVVTFADVVGVTTGLDSAATVRVAMVAVTGLVGLTRGAGAEIGTVDVLVLTLAEVVGVSTDAEVEMEVATCSFLFGVTRGAYVVAMVVVTATEVVGLSTGSEAGEAAVVVALVTVAGFLSFTRRAGVDPRSVKVLVVIAWQCTIAYGH